jgi:23S rRNA (cytidine1920-2'-O)/16S rRNA (cytidine1409-2'-O)-methyltransferase
LDRILTLRGLADSRAKAQALVLAGQVRSQGVRLEKPGSQYPVDVALEIEPLRRYVSRGGHKLEPALGRFSVDVTARDALDVGVEHGARRVIALDVGRGQLDWSLRNDPRVFPLEGVNARYLDAAKLPFLPSLAVIDVSFISLELVLPPVVASLSAEGEIVALLKPQFEVGRGQVGRGGIVRDPDLHRGALRRGVAFCGEHGWGVAGLCTSALSGAEGNREFFLHLQPSTPGLAATDLERRIERAVAGEADDESAATKGTAP